MNSREKNIRQCNMEAQKTYQRRNPRTIIMLEPARQSKQISQDTMTKVQQRN